MDVVNYYYSPSFRLPFLFLHTIFLLMSLAQRPLLQGGGYYSKSLPGEETPTPVRKLFYL